MAKRRPLFESLEERLCMAAGPVLQTTFSLPSTGSWTPTVYRASPIFVDIFNTGKDDLITVAAGAKLIAYAENPDGSATPVVTYQVPGGVADIKSTPIVVTDPTTGQKDLFAAMGRDETNPGTLEDGRVFGWNLKTGALLPGWTLGQSTGKNVTGYSGVYGALTSGDLEGNGMPDIVVTSFSHNVTAFRLNGSMLWQWTNDDTDLSGAVIGDIDRDGKPEVVVGGDSGNNPFFHNNGGWVNVLSNTGTLKWRQAIPGEVTWSSPVLADLNNNGYLDIVIGTGLNYQLANTRNPGSYPNAQDLGARIYAFDPFGNLLPGWPYATTFPGNPVPHEVLAAPAVADLLGNGQLDIVALDRAGYIHVIQPNGKDLPGFEGGKAIAPEFKEGSLNDDYASPVIADINGDGRPEIIGSYGPFLRAFDTSGNLINITNTSTPPGASTPEGIDLAPAIGNFDGTGGLTMAFVSYNAQNQNRPDQVQILRLPVSTLAPPWPFIRRTVTGDAVARSTVFDHQYVASAFRALVGSVPNQAALQLDVALDTDAISLLTATELIAGSSAARQAKIQADYQSFLGHAADSYSLSYWSNYLSGNTYRQMEILLASSGEFAQRAKSNLGQEIVQLYQAILKRTPAQSDVNNWIATKLPIGSIATIFLNSPEALALQLKTFYAAAFGAQKPIPADASAAYAYDIHQGAREDVIFSNILASNGNYAATNFVAGYIEDLYRDVLHRDAAPSDVAYWLGSIDNRSVAFSNLAGVILNSPEARGIYIQSEFLALLGHGADPATIASLQNYTSRENIVIMLVGSPEYFNVKSKGSAATFVVNAFQDLAGIGITQAVVNSFVAEMSSGKSTAAIAQQIITGGALYFTNTIVNELQVYLPNEQLGVLRSGNLPPTAAGQPINPDPSLIQGLLGLQNQGYSDEQIIALLLTSPAYYSRVSYYKGLLRSPGIRN